MNMADILRQFESGDENLIVIQILGMKTFNALGSALKLALSGYNQNSALMMNDILETVFLMELFREDRSKTAKRRLVDKKARKTKYGRFKAHVKLDDP